MQHELLKHEHDIHVSVSCFVSDMTCDTTWIIETRTQHELEDVSKS